MILTGNIQDVRLLLVDMLNDATPDGWTATADTRLDVYTGLIQVGHVTEIKADTYKTFGCGLTLTLWADETGDVLNAAALYALLSPIDGSLLRFFLRDKECPITEFTIGEVGKRRPNDGDGPSTYLACDIAIRFQVTSS